MRRRINTSKEVITACGGTSAVARHFGIDNERVVSNWKTRGLPPETFDGFQQLLAERKLTAPKSLWRQRSLAGEAAE